MVCSQSSPGHKYTVDIDDYTCDCDSYPLIDFCKHLAAVQLHFFEGVEVRDLASLFIPTKPSADPLTASRQPLREPSTTPPPVISDISDRLQRLAIRYLASPPSILSDCLRRLDTLLDRALAECGQSQVLPAPQRIVPNQHSWPETAATMIGAVKNKRKSKHTDPYSGGQRSGNHAKPDARGPPASGSRGGLNTGNGGTGSSSRCVSLCSFVYSYLNASTEPCPATSRTNRLASQPH